MLFIFVYALGIPMFMHVAMRAQGIVGIVKEKMDAAKFQAMLSLFIKNATSVEAHRMARLVSTVTDELEFQRQSKQARESFKMCSGVILCFFDLKIAIAGIREDMSSLFGPQKSGARRSATCCNPPQALSRVRREHSHSSPRAKRARDRHRKAESCCRRYAITRN